MRPPASAAGHNGSAMSHPFMFELIGDFDIGRDRFEDPQRQAALEVVAVRPVYLPSRAGGPAAILEIDEPGAAERIAAAAAESAAAEGITATTHVLHGDPADEICAAGERLDADLLVIGSRNSSNSNRLVEVARAGGVASYLIDDETDIDEDWLDDARVVGITSGASAPEKLVERVCDWFRARGVERIEPFKSVHEDVVFRLPVELRRELALAETQS